MNRKRYIFWTGIIATMLLIPVAHAADLAEGYSGIAWGANLADNSSLSKLYERDAIVYFTNPNEIHTIHDVQVPDVVYGSYSGRFFSVLITIDSMRVFAELKRELKQKYGLPDIKTSTKSEETIYKWKHKDVKIKLKAKESENALKLAFYYTPISNQVNESQLEEIQEKRLRVLPIDKNKRPKALPLLTF